MCVCVCVVYVYMCMCTHMCAFTYIYIYIYIFYVYIYIYVLNIPIFCAIWLKKCDFSTEKLGIKPDPDPKWFIPDPDPDPAQSSGSDRIRIRLRIRIHNTAAKLSDWLINASVRVGVWWTPAFQTRSVIGWFFPPGFLIGWFSLRSGLVFVWRLHSRHSQSLACFSRQAFWLVDFRFDVWFTPAFQTRSVIGCFSR